MALVASKVEQAYRRVMGLEQRLDKLYVLIPLSLRGAVGLSDSEIPLTHTQKTSLKTAVSQVVAQLEIGLAALETLLAGTTSVVPGPVGVGITDWSAANSIIIDLKDQRKMPDIREKLRQSITQNYVAERTPEGELTSDGVGPDFINQLKLVLETRVEAVRVAVVTLRALGA